MHECPGVPVIEAPELSHLGIHFRMPPTCLSPSPPAWTTADTGFISDSLISYSLILVLLPPPPFASHPYYHHHSPGDYCFFGLLWESPCGWTTQHPSLLSSFPVMQLVSFRYSLSVQKSLVASSCSSQLLTHSYF